MKQLPVNDGFDHNDKKYLCCCGHYHILTGVFIVGIYVALSLVPRLIASFREESLFFSVIELAGIPCVVLLFVGINKLNPRFVLPFVFFTALGVITSIFFYMISVYGVVTTKEGLFDRFLEYHKVSLEKNLKHADLQDVFIVSVMIYPLIILFNYLFFNIANRCYRYLKDYELHRLRNGSVALDGQQHIPPRFVLRLLLPMRNFLNT